MYTPLEVQCCNYVTWLSGVWCSQDIWKRALSYVQMEPDQRQNTKVDDHGFSGSAMSFSASVLHGFTGCVVPHLSCTFTAHTEDMWQHATFYMSWDYDGVFSLMPALVLNSQVSEKRTNLLFTALHHHCFMLILVSAVTSYSSYCWCCRAT